MKCANCDHVLRASDKFCPACGQSVKASRDRSFAHLVRLGFEELTSVDSRLWRSLGNLVFRPGVLSRAYREGRRKQFLTPIGLFLLGNLLYFLSPPLSDLQLSLSDQYELQPYRSLITGWVDRYIASVGTTFEHVARLYELRVAELAKIMVILNVPLIALATLLLFVDRRLYYADHVVIALHYLAFLMIYLITTSTLLNALYWLVPTLFQANSGYLVKLILLAQFLYVPPMLKHAMGVSWWRALLFTPLFIVCFFFVHLAYRFIQFCIAFSMVTFS